MGTLRNDQLIMVGIQLWIGDMYGEAATCVEVIMQKRKVAGIEETALDTEGVVNSAVTNGKLPLEDCRRTAIGEGFPLRLRFRLGCRGLLMVVLSPFHVTWWAGTHFKDTFGMIVMSDQGVRGIRNNLSTNRSS